GRHLIRWSRVCVVCFFFSSRRRHTRSTRDWSSDVCSSDLAFIREVGREIAVDAPVAIALRVSEQIVEMNEGEPRAMNKPVHLRRSEERRVGKEWRSRWGLKE